MFLLKNWARKWCRICSDLSEIFDNFPMDQSTFVFESKPTGGSLRDALQNFNASSLKIARRFFLVAPNLKPCKNLRKYPWHIWWFVIFHGWWWRSSCLNGRCGSFRWRVGGLREANHERSAGAKQSSKDQRLGRYLAQNSLNSNLDRKA